MARSRKLPPQFRPPRGTRGAGRSARGRANAAPLTGNRDGMPDRSGWSMTVGICAPASPGREGMRGSHRAYRHGCGSSPMAAVAVSPRPDRDRSARSGPSHGHRLEDAELGPRADYARQREACRLQQLPILRLGAFASRQQHEHTEVEILAITRLLPGGMRFRPPASRPSAGSAARPFLRIAAQRDSSQLCRMCFRR